MTTPESAGLVGALRALIERALERARVFDDGSDGADAESARSVVALLTKALATPGAGVVDGELDRVKQLRRELLDADGCIKAAAQACDDAEVEHQTCRAIALRNLIAATPAPVAVEGWNLPKFADDDSGMLGPYSKGHNTGWNECIAEFKRLNPAPQAAAQVTDADRCELLGYVEACADVLRRTGKPIMAGELVKVANKLAALRPNTSTVG